jgi:hypothetical protein
VNRHQHRAGAGLAVAGATLALLRRPALWGAAARLLPPGWWRRWPPRPWPPGDYLRFRLQTMYGDDARLNAADLISYLEWCRRMGQSAR